MNFTAIHRAAGAEPGELTDEILDMAIEKKAREAEDLDWKQQLPAQKDLKTSDFPKDVAAMANSGGGVIVYGVLEEDKAATGRVNEDKCNENYERTLRDVARSAIIPPIFNLGVFNLGPEECRAVVVNVPGSVEVPHLVRHKGSPEFYGGPRRNDADTYWMTERELESLYRARFDERRHSTETLDALSAEASAGRDTAKRAWLIAVAYPRLPQLRGRLTQEEARSTIGAAAVVGGDLTTKRRLIWADGLVHGATARGPHPLTEVGIWEMRTGLRRWIAPPKGADWREAWASVHHDGSVTLAAVVGGHRKIANSYHESWEVSSWAIEAAVADFMALIRTTAERTSNDEYDLRIACEWDGAETMTFRQNDAEGYTWEESGMPVHHYTPVESSIRARQPAEEFHNSVFTVARDCLNQGGVSDLYLIDAPQRDGSSRST